MKVPLSIGYCKSGLEILSKKKEKVGWYDLPFDDYVTVLTRKGNKKGIEVGSLVERNYEFRTAKGKRSREKVIDTLDKYNAYYSYMGYLQKLIIYHPDFTEKYPLERYPRVASFDIETLTKADGLFPIPKDNPIVSIGVSYEGEYYAFDDYDVGEKDKYILQDFFGFLKNKRLDVLTGYNSENFDVPYIYKRAQLLDLDASYFTKLWNERHFFPNFVHVDLYKLVQEDQVLKPKNYKLKTIANHFGIDAMELDHQEMNNIQGMMFKDENTLKSRENGSYKKLREYQKSDAYATKKVLDAYIDRCIKTAEMLSVPLDNIVNKYPGFEAKVIQARALRDADYVSVLTNVDKYQGALESDPKHEAEIIKVNDYSLSFEGAIIECYKEKEFIDDLYKGDFRSMYPHAQITLDTGPDNTYIEDVKEYDPLNNFEQLRVLENDGQYLTIEVPDSNYKKNLIIVINIGNGSFLSDKVKELYIERSKYKKKMYNASDDAEKKMWDSSQYAHKVTLNAIYGYNGRSKTKLGDLSVAIAIIAFCRDITRFVENEYKRNLVATDTDGILLDCDFPACDIPVNYYTMDKEKRNEFWSNVSNDDINKKVRNYIISKYGIESFMFFEKEFSHYKCWSYKRKNYVLEDNNGDIKKTGVTLKGRDKYPLYRKCVDDLIDYKFDKKDVDLEKYVNLRNFPISMFFKKFSARHLDDYKEETGYHSKLVRKWMDRKGLDNITEGTTVRFFVSGPTKRLRKYMPIVMQDEFSKNDINYDYYRKDLKKLFDRFEIEYPNKVSVSDYGLY